MTSTALPRAFGLRLGAALGAMVIGMSLTSPALTAPTAVAAPSVPDAVADPATALKLAHETNKHVEVTSQTTESSDTVANPDGTWTLSTHSEPVRMRQNGGWVSLDATLVKRPDGNIAPKALPLDLVLNAGGAGSAAAPVVRVGIDDKQAGLVWPADLPVPSLNGDTATYANVFPDVDLQVEATTRGYSENLVVKTAAAARSSALASITFGLFTRNTTVSASANGLQVKDNSGAVLFAGDASSMWDSSGVGTGAERELGPGGGDKHATMAVSATANSVTVTPDHTFLTDPATKFPVVLDPDSSCATCVSQAHVVVQSGFPSAMNYNQTVGDLSNLKAGYETQDGAKVSRSYFQMNTTQLAGAVIHTATVNTTLQHSAACTVSANDTTGLWLTGPIGPTTSWAPAANGAAGQPQLVLGISTSNQTNCHDEPGVSMQFDAKAAADYAVSHGVTSTTFMLASTADVDLGQQDANSWRRFTLDQTFQVTYNKPPNMPTNLAIQSRLPCVQGADRPWIATRTPELDGVATDPDGGNVIESFGLDQGTVGNYVPNTHHSDSQTVGSGSVARLKVHDDWITQDGTYTWVSADWDGDLWSNQTSGCEFTVDSLPPPAPTVKMTGNPPSTQGDTATFQVTVGLATPGLNDIDRFIYTTDGSEPDVQNSPSVPAARILSGGSGATASLTVTAVNSLQNYIHVRAVNRAGTASLADATCVAGLTLDAPSCSYNVPNALVPSTGLVGAWGFDEMGDRVVADSVASTPGNEQTPAHPGTLVGGGDWRPGHDHGTPWTHPDTNGYAHGTAGSLTLDGSSGYVTAGAPVVDTSQSFSVSAWVYLAQAGKFATAVSQTGTNSGAFYLQYAKDTNNWAFTLPSDDSNNPAAYYRATANPDNPVQFNVWTHLVGTYDSSSGAIKLYVNGSKQQPAAGKAWHATGPLTIGAAGGGTGDFFPGEIDSPQVWQRVLSDKEVHDLANTAAPLAQYNLGEGCGPDLTAKTSNVISRAAYWPLDEGSGATAKDVGQYADNATLTGGYAWTDGPLGGKAVHLDGASGTAGTQYSVVDTSRSFTVSAWAKLDDLNNYYAVVAQHGIKQDAFQIRYSPDVNRWIFGMSAADDASADNYQWTYKDQAPQAGRWTLVTGVFDRGTMQIKLYLDGKLQSQRGVSAVWQATGSTSIGSLGGRSAFFKGAIGQVQMWNQALTDDQIAALDNLGYYDTVSRSQGSSVGGISLVDDADGCSAQVDSTNTGKMQAARPANLRTDHSYTVEAWVKHTWTAADVQASGPVDPNTRSAVSTSDAPNLPFALGYRNVNGHGKWSFTVSASPGQTGSWTAASDPDVADNTWTHLEGVYDATTHTATLYVNGARQSTAVTAAGATGSVAGWNGSAGVLLGQDTWNGQTTDQWHGGIAGVRIYSGILTDAEAVADKPIDDPGLLYGIRH
ncbi:LamG domain-containing protein [Kutzneria sp. NPDC052558]|uniref:LamG domain-containing protein n=1 Tax=Kutzneria sp. NPDC052558 TaxID=3364121 RepID=UPI0037C7E401